MLSAGLWERFGDRVVLRTMAGGVVIAIVVYIYPELMFDGYAQIQPIIKNRASYGVALLLLFALLEDLAAGTIVQER